MSPVASSLVTLVVALALSLATGYPTNKDEEAYYYNRLHDFPDNYNKDVRNLDGIDARDDSPPMFTLLTKLDQDFGSEKGSQRKYQFGSNSHLDGIGGGHLVRDLELAQGGGNLLRDLDMLRNRAAFFSRGNRDSGPEERKRYHSMDTIKGQSLGGSKRNVRGCCDIFGGAPIGNQKRNMDEIDRSSFNSFIKKNFDEIDRSGFGSFVKRNFDEIDHSRFGQFVKRSAPAVPEQN